MVDVNKYKNGHDYDCFNIVTDDGEFSIQFENNLDLYWSYLYKENFLDTKDSYEINVTKENYFLFLLFDELYENIKNDKIILDEDVLSSRSGDRERLFINDSVCYISDDFPEDEASFFEIKKVDEDTFNLKFTKSKSKNYFNTFSVRITNSGCRYGYFNVLFMQMYNKMSEYFDDEKYHQMHVEEVVYLRKRGR